MSVILSEEIEHLTGRLDAIIREQAGDRVLQHLDWIRRLAAAARRQQTADIGQLRAIPWVFAWTQSRHLLSAWYGVGHALAGFQQQEAGGLEKLREMYRHWPFFQTLLDNAEVSLAKTELGIAAQYARLVRSRAVRDKVFGLIRSEYERSVEMVLHEEHRLRAR